jgi:short-subunit dehydrogenase
VEAISDALRLETAAFGVTVSLIQPGPVQSAFADTAVSTMDLGAPEGPYGAFHRTLAQRYATAYGGRAAERNVTPEAVAQAVLRAAGDHPRPRYAVGVVAKSLITGRRLLPDQVWDRVVRSVWPTPGTSGVSR